ncbi:hypothetical protein ES708_12289 [subsurface metagenome]
MKPLTKEELQALEGIIPEDKELIERIVDDAVGEDPDDIRVRVIRGYLASRLIEEVPSDSLRAALGQEAANFDDG